MGRKKTKRAAPKKVSRAKLEKSFACPFCNHESTIECKIDRSRQIGTLSCRICSAGYQTVINSLSEPIDVFSEWVDAIESQDKKKAEPRATEPSTSRASAEPATEQKRPPAKKEEVTLKKKKPAAKSSRYSESSAEESEGSFLDDDEDGGRGVFSSEESEAEFSD